MRVASDDGAQAAQDQNDVNHALVSDLVPDPAHPEQPAAYSSDDRGDIAGQRQEFHLFHFS